MDFASLHSHSTFSYGDGFGMPEDHVKRVAELGMSALALTEHGNMTSVPKLYKAALAAGIKPIYGLEAYTAPSTMREDKNQRKWHQTILAADQDGYQNLMALTTRSWSPEGFYRWPTINWQMLAEHSKGLIVTSGCADSLLACTLLGGKGIEHGDKKRAERVMLAYRDLFGDRYYLETQRFPQLERTCTLNAQYARWSAKYGIPLVATADVHYPYPADNEMQKILHAGSRNTGTVEAAEAEWEYDILLTYPYDDDNIMIDLMKTGLSSKEAATAVSNSGIIADRCNVDLPIMDQVTYPYAEDGAASEEALLRRWLNEGWSYRQIPLAKQRAYKQRAEWELEALRNKGFLSYVLMLADAIRFAKSRGIAVGPGRGSGAGSLVLWLLRITEVNSMDFPLMLFERFIAPDRDDLPDVDIDFESDRRDEVRQYLISKYGIENVGNVGTLTYYRGKNTIDMIGRTHQIPFPVTRQIKDMLVVDSGADNSIATTRALFPVVEDLFKQYPALAYAERLEGNVAGFGIHAAGLVVGADRLDKYVATYSKDVGTGRHKKNVQVLSVDKYDGELLGLLKIDALGLKTMSIIKSAADAIGMSMDKVYRIPLEDPEVLAGFREGQVGGVFQFEGSTTRDICVEVAPVEFMDLAHITSLSRPGPLHGGSTADFIKARQRGIRTVWPPAIEQVLRTTEGEIVYQEQVILLAREVGGFDSVGASKVRSIISKKKGQAAFAELYDEFLAGAKEREVRPEDAAKVWRKMVTSGAYSFNVAHAVSYSVLSAWCMWFRVHHPLEFFFARLKHNVGEVNAKTKVPVTETILKDMAASSGLKLLDLDVTRSGYSWSVEDGALRPGFAQIPGIGEVVGQAIVDWRDGLMVPPSDWNDLLEVSGIGPKTIEGIVAFASSPDPFGIGKIGRNTQGIVKAIESFEIAAEDGSQLPHPGKVSSDIPFAAGRWEGTLLGVVREVIYKDLFETHRNRTGKDLDPTSVDDPHLSKSVSMYCEDVRGAFKINVGRYKFPHFKEQIERLKVKSDYVLVTVGKSDRFPGKTTFVNDMWVIEPDER